jgi:O-antigen ligase
LAIVGIGCLAVITLVSPGATRMFAWPWSLAYAGALIAPALILVLRAFDACQPLVLPSTGWRILAIATAATVVASTLASPYRAEAVRWAAPELAAIATFFAIFDWLHRGTAAELRRETLWRIAAAVFLVIGATSLVLWATHLPAATARGILFGRNAYPLGHSNYTAGLALLMIPCFATGAVRSRGKTRAIAIVGVLLALAMLFTSSSRAGVIALGVLALVGFVAAPWRLNVKMLVAVAAVLATIAFVAANPRTRAMLLPADPAAPPNLSNVQRSAMLLGGWRMGRDRPLLGWGPGTTPLAFPRYRAGLDGGAENVLQLHSLPVQLWADLGAAGILCALGFVLLVFRNGRHDRVAAVTLAGYAAFALFDAQLDVPVFGYAIALLAALLAVPSSNRSSSAATKAIGILTLAILGLVAGFGRRDPTPELNVRALSPEFGRAQPQRAIALLHDSLGLNPDQEIAHFNLGWLLVVEDPAAAEKHFVAAARLVPDKGGVYFGIGLARLNQGHAAEAARAFALEALNDPIFLRSPWWRAPQFADLRAAFVAELVACEDEIVARLPSEQWTAGEVRYLRALTGWLEGQLDARAVAAAANTPARRQYFAGTPDRNAPEFGATQILRRQRTGYPVLMRNLDLPPPMDLLDVEQSAVRTSRLAFVFPEKGWLPSPLLLALLDERVSPKK